MADTKPPIEYSKHIYITPDTLDTFEKRDVLGFMMLESLGYEIHVDQKYIGLNRREIDHEFWFVYEEYGNMICKCREKYDYKDIWFYDEPYDINKTSRHNHTHHTSKMLVDFFKGDYPYVQ